VNTAMRWQAQNSKALSGATSATRTWVANLVVYMPFVLQWDYPVKRLFWANGSNASSSVDMGVFSREGVKLFSTGITAQVGASEIQYVTVDRLLSHGAYYLAWTCNGTTSRAHTFGGTAAAARLSGFYEETTGVFGLPATWTPVAYARGWGAVVCGVTRTASGF
jgi:hypothetical protein